MNENISSEDSNIFVNLYTENWIRESILKAEAAKLASNSETIDKLTEEYRSSLIIQEFERSLLAQFPDTLVTKAEN